MDPQSRNVCKMANYEQEEQANENKTNGMQPQPPVCNLAVTLLPFNSPPVAVTVSSL